MELFRHESLRIEAALLAVSLCTLPGAAAAGVLDYIRNYDLNDYALGLSVSLSQSPYAGADDSVVAYPYLTSFRNPAFTEDWLVISDNTLGLRYLGDGGLEVGGLGRINTTGLGNSRVPELRDLQERQSTIELGPYVGWRGRALQVHLRAYAEILGRHDGYTGELAFTVPREWERGFLVPSVELIYQSDDYNDYYFGVDDSEAGPGRPAYAPAGDLGWQIRLRYGYQLSDRWLLSGAVGAEILADAVTDSPIVGRSRRVFGNVGLAYNANVFQPREPYPDYLEPIFEFRIGAFLDMIDSSFERDTEDGRPGDEVDLEGVLGSSADELVAQWDTFYRLGRHHRLELSYFELGRDSLTTTTEPLVIGRLDIPPGTELATSSSFSTLRVAYAYSLIKDAQKELGVMGGLHYYRSRIELRTDSGETDSVRVSAPLPVVGAHGSVAVGKKGQLGARVQVYAADFDRYEGALLFAALDFQRRLADGFSLGLGYNYYGSELESPSEELRGTLRVRHHGPTVFLSFSF